MRNEQGFSMIKMMFWGGIIAAGVVYVYMVLPVYNAYWKVQDTFEGVAKTMKNASEQDIRQRLPDLFKIKYLASNDVPQEFYDNMEIKADAGRVEISSFYHTEVWFLGPLEGVDPEAEPKYSEADLKGMDKIRYKLHQEFDFEPHAETP